MLRTQRYAVGAAAGTFVLALAVSACGSSGTSSAPSSSGSGSSSSSSQPAAGTLTTAKADKVGTVVVDGKGFVLYRFDEDTAKPSKSNCYGTCATLWPAAPATGNVNVKGIDKSLVGTVTRADGSKQLTLAGWPLYRYSKDDQPHEAYGQGVGGIWFAATPTGAKAASDTGGSSGGGSGY
ncbi:hypothetical protein ACFXOD_20835 [Streptomyces sp. NPDC059161]|uniref:hypothetical protein n=1 Tax=Streptomyces sp. NPDC059161 TaxID=3346749 RepID=UPI003679D3E4